MEEGWLLSYLDNADNVILQKSDSLSDRFAERLKSWKTRSFIFVAEDMKSGSFKRKISRLGKKKECSAKATDRQIMVSLLLAQSKMEVKERLVDKLTVGAVYWLIERARLTETSLDELVRREELPMLNIVEWDSAVYRMPTKDLLWRVACVIAALRLLKTGESKWRVVQEAIRMAPNEVSGMYAGGLRLSESTEKTVLLGKRMQLVSTLVEDGVAPPASFIYLAGNSVK